MEDVTATLMTYDELDALVNMAWDGWGKGKQTFESVAEFEWNNYEHHLVQGVKPAKDLKEVQAWVKGGERPFCQGIHQLFEALCSEGIVPPGNYIVDVSW